MEELEILALPESRDLTVPKEIARLAADSLTYNEFFEFMLSNRPVIISGLSQRWKCSEKWLSHGIDLEYLRLNIKDRVVPVSNCSKQYYNSHAKTEMSFHKYLAWWHNRRHNKETHDTTEELLYLKDWHLQLEEGYENPFYEVPPFFGSDWLNEYLMATGNKDDFRFVYMGPKGSWLATNRFVKQLNVGTNSHIIITGPDSTRTFIRHFPGPQILWAENDGYSFLLGKRRNYWTSGINCHSLLIWSC